MKQEKKSVVIEKVRKIIYDMMKTQLDRLFEI